MPDPTYGTYNDFVILNPEYHSGQVEFIAQNLAIFNAASNNALRLDVQTLPGLYEKKTFFALAEDIISRRNPLVNTAVSDAKLTQEDHYKIKLNRRIGPIAQTLDAWRKIGSTPATMSYIFGKMVAEGKMKDNIDTILTALMAAIESVSTASGTYDLVYDGTSDGTGDTVGQMQPDTLANGMCLFGDNFSELTCVVMHSKPFLDLVKNQVNANIFQISGLVISGGMPATFGRPVVVIDAPALVEDAASGVSGYTKVYKTLALVPDAASVTETELETLVYQVLTGSENIAARVQGEYAINIGMKGISYKYSTGGANPTMDSIASGLNWERVATSIKHCPGVVIKTR